jgi:hypothetical protein
MILHLNHTKDIAEMERRHDDYAKLCIFHSLRSGIKQEDGTGSEECSPRQEHTLNNNTPNGEQVSVKEEEKKRVVNEEEKKPVVKEEEKKPVVNVEEEKPVVNVGEKKPVVKEEEKKPVVKEEEKKPVVKEEEKKPVVKEEEKKPVVKEKEKKPVVKEEEKKPVGGWKVTPEVKHGKGDKPLVEALGEDLGKAPRKAPGKALGKSGGGTSELQQAILDYVKVLGFNAASLFYKVVVYLAYLLLDLLRMIYELLTHVVDILIFLSTFYSGIPTEMISDKLHKMVKQRGYDSDVIVTIAMTIFAFVLVLFLKRSLLQLSIQVAKFVSWTHTKETMAHLFVTIALLVLATLLTNKFSGCRSTDLTENLGPVIWVVVFMALYYYIVPGMSLTPTVVIVLLFSVLIFYFIFMYQFPLKWRTTRRWIEKSFDYGDDDQGKGKGMKQPKKWKLFHFFILILALSYVLNPITQPPDTWIDPTASFQQVADILDKSELGPDVINNIPEEQIVILRTLLTSVDYSLDIMHKKVIDFSVIYLLYQQGEDAGNSGCDNDTEQPFTPDNSPAVDDQTFKSAGLNQDGKIDPTQILAPELVSGQALVQTFLQTLEQTSRQAPKQDSGPGSGQASEQALGQTLEDAFGEALEKTMCKASGKRQGRPLGKERASDKEEESCSEQSRKPFPFPEPKNYCSSGDFVPRDEETGGGTLRESDKCENDESNIIHVSHKGVIQQFEQIRKNTGELVVDVSADFCDTLRNPGNRTATDAAINVAAGVFLFTILGLITTTGKLWAPTLLIR